MARAYSSPCLPVAGRPGPTPPETGSKRIGRDDRLANSDFEFGVCERSERASEDDDRQESVSQHGHFLEVKLVRTQNVLGSAMIILY